MTCSYTQTTVPPLSTVSVDKESLGRKTVEQLFNIVQGNAGPALRIRGKLVVRGSSAGAPEAAAMNRTAISILLAAAVFHAGELFCAEPKIEIPRFRL